MYFRPVQQEIAFSGMVISMVTLLFVAVGVISAWRSRQEGIGSLMLKVLGFALGGFPIAFALWTMLTSTAYNFPESYLTQGFLLGVGR